MSANGAAVYLGWLAGVLIGIGGAAPDYYILSAGAGLTLLALGYFKRFGNSE